MASSVEKSPRKVSAFAVYQHSRNEKSPKQLTKNTHSAIKHKREFESEDEEDKDVKPPIVKAKRGRQRKIVKKEVETSETAVIEIDEDRDVNEDESHENQNTSVSELPTLNTITPDKLEEVPCGNKISESFFKWLINPVKPDAFFEENFDKEPLLVQRSKSNYYKGLFSSGEFDKIIKENNLEYGREIDVVAYVKNKRRTVTNESKVHPSFVWKAYHDGYSIRMRNPQVYHKQLWKICSFLQEYFSSFVGVNMYLTPAGSQGFPPHYDDIDAFILQIEGKKCWKLYKPRDENEVLDRYSSGDMNEDEIGEPCMVVELKAGDMLYFPRGYIHQAVTTEDAHSLHLTLSTNQLNTWGDLLQVGLPRALELAIKNNVAFRKTLPKDYMNYIGSAFADLDSSKRKSFKGIFSRLAKKALDYLSVDYAADIHATDFIHGSMPPIFNQNELSCSIHGNGNRLEDGEVRVSFNLTAQTKIRLIRKRAFRLVMDAGGIRLFHSLGNPKGHKEDEAQFMEVEVEFVNAINLLLRIHPDYVEVDDLPIDCADTRIGLAQELYDHGFLMTKSPLPYES